MFDFETKLRHLRLSGPRGGGSGETVETPTDHGIRVPGGAVLPEHRPDLMDRRRRLGNLYSNAANWSIGVVPNNLRRQTTYDVEIPAASAVTMDINPTIDNLTLDAASSSLNIEAARSFSHR